MKRITMLFLGLLSTLILITHSLAEVKILAPQKGGAVNKVYTQNKPQLNVVTYNIAAARVAPIDDIANAIKTLNADLIALNEVDNNTGRSGKLNQVAKLAELTNMYSAFGKAIDFDGGEYGVAILSKYPIEKQQVFALPSGEDEQRVLLVIQVNHPDFDAPILFMTTHLSWQEDPALRMQQIREIANITIGNTDSLFAEIASQIKILAGDFNDVIGSAPLAELQRYWHLVEDKTNDIRTWPAINPAIDLDHILTYRGQRWEVEKMVTPNQQATWQQINWPAVSDHVPVMASLRLLEQ